MKTLWEILVLLALLAGSSESQARGTSCTTEDQQQGVCISIRHCPPLRNLLGQIQAGTAPKDATSILRRAICNLDTEILICCSETSRAVLPTVRNATFTELSKTCGILGLIDRIIDGLPAPLRSWPWMVALRGNTGGRSFWFCGGTLISNFFVLTAAHCFKQTALTLEYARIGEHNLKNSIDCELGVCAPPPQNIPVSDIILHPSYRNPCKECNDIAILKLSRAANFDPLFVKPICLPVDPLKDMGYSVREFQEQVAWTAGWGIISQDHSKPQKPDILQQVQLPIQELPHCTSLKASYPNRDMVLCAGGDGRDTCLGDSGGPLTLTSNSGTKHFIIGVTSLGPRVCGARHTQGLYTSVHHYIPWIRSVLTS